MPAPTIRVNKTTAYELNGQFYPTMPEAEIAVREAVVLAVIESDLSSQASQEDVAACIARRWTEIKNRCDDAFKGI
jgi:hypothetical protein